MTPKSLFLLTLVWLLFQTYISQLVRCARYCITGQFKASFSQYGKLGSFLAHLLWVASTAFPTYYSCYIPFIYINDGYIELLGIQILLSLQQFYLNWFVSRMFDRHFDSSDNRNRHPLPGCIALGFTLFKLGFNFFVESFCGNGTLPFRTIFFVLGDLVSLPVILLFDPTVKPLIKFHSPKTRSLLYKTLLPAITVVGLAVGVVSIFKQRTC